MKADDEAPESRPPLDRRTESVSPQQPSFAGRGLGAHAGPDGEGNRGKALFDWIQPSHGKENAAVTELRLQCIVEGCQRSTKQRGLYAEWMCAKHWRSVERSLRDEFNVSKRKTRTAFRRMMKQPTKLHIRAHRRTAGREVKLWQSIIEIATIKDAMGALND